MSDKELELPKAQIVRMMKAVVGNETAIGKDVKDVMSTASKVFIHYVVACANDICRKGNRSKIDDKDIIAALKELEMGDFVPEIEQMLAEKQKEAKNSKKAAAAADDDDEDDEEDDE